MMGGSLVLRSYVLTIRGVLQGLDLFGWDSMVVGADRGILLVFSGAALVSGTGLRGLAIAFVAARAAALALSAWMAHAKLGGIGMGFDRAVSRDLQMRALPLGLFLVVLNLYSYVDGVMLGAMRTDVETGLYAGAYRIYEGMSYIPSIIYAVLMPRLSELFVSDRAAHRRLARRGLTGAAGLAIVMGAVAYLVATPLVVWILGAAFAPAVGPFRILCVGLVLVFAIWVVHAITISVNRERLLVKTAIIGLAVNVGLDLYVIPRMGATGAALATVVGELVSLGVLLLGLRRRDPVECVSDDAYLVGSLRGAPRPSSSRCRAIRG